MTRPTEREYTRLTGALADMPVLIKRILLLHDPTGVCRACSTPGGRIVIMAPCAVRSLAMHAQAVRFERGQTISKG